MKRKLIVLLVLLMTATVFMAGCGSKEEPVKPAEEAGEEQEDAQEEAQSESEGQEATVSEDVVGVLSEGGYTNEFFGVQYEAPEGWYVYAREEVAELMGIVSSSIDDDSIKEMYESDGYIMDLYAVNVAQSTQTYDNVNITIQDIGKIYGLIYNEKQIAEASLESVKQSLEAQGVTDIVTELGEMDFMGKPCVYMTINSKAGDILMFQKQVYLKNGSGMACITATTFNEDRTDEILASFKAK